MKTIDELRAEVLDLKGAAAVLIYPEFGKAAEAQAVEMGGRIANELGVDVIVVPHGMRVEVLPRHEFVSVEETTPQGQGGPDDGKSTGTAPQAP